jgi:hypothetical protein
MAVAAYWSEVWLRRTIPFEVLGSRDLSRLLSVGGAIGTAVCTLALTAWALRISEFRQAMERIVAKIK